MPLSAEPAPPICAVPAELSAVCGPPLAGVLPAENDAFGSAPVPSCDGDALATVGAACVAYGAREPVPYRDTSLSPPIAGHRSD